MKHWILVLSALFFSLTALTTSLFARGPKVGYAETTVLIREFEPAIQARKELEEAQKGWEKNMNLLNDSLLATMDRMKAEYEGASPDKRREMRVIIENRNEDLKRYTNAVRRMSEDKERALMEPVVKKINSFLEAWGKENGYDLILGTTGQGNILQASPDLNLTSKVLSAMNAHYRNLPKKAPKADKPASKKTP